MQSQRVDSLVKLGHLAVCTDSKNGVDTFIKEFEMTRVSQWQTSDRRGLTSEAHQHYTSVS